MATIAPTADAIKVRPGRLEGVRRALAVATRRNQRFWFSLSLIALLLVFSLLGPTIFGKSNPMKLVGGLYDSPSAEATCSRS